MSSRSSLRYSLTLLASVALGACSFDQASFLNAIDEFDIARSEVSAEELLNAKSFSSFKGMKVASLSYTSPLAMHASARKQVHYSQIANSARPYTTRPKLSEMKVASNFRVLELQPKSALFNGGAFALAAVDIIPGDRGFVPAPGAKPEISQNSFQLAEATVTSPAKPAVKRSVVARPDPDALKVTSLTMGSFDDKTRLVLDLSGAAQFDYDLNNVESALIVHVSGAGWNMRNQEQIKNHPLIKGYEVTELSDNEAMLRITLRKPSRMLMSGTVRPDKQHGHRIVFDMAEL